MTTPYPLFASRSFTRITALPESQHCLFKDQSEGEAQVVAAQAFQIVSGIGWAALYQAYEDRFEWMTHLKVDPAWDCIQDDARFLELLRLLRLP